MAFLLGSAMVISATSGLLSQRKAGKEAKAAGEVQERALRTEAARTEADLFERARAADMQHDLIADRLLLEQRSETEAARQAKQPGVEFNLGESAADRVAATKRRSTFFDFGSGA